MFDVFLKFEFQLGRSPNFGTVESVRESKMFLPFD